MNKMTEWFPPEIKPVRKGVYEVRKYGFDMRRTNFAYWDGKFWGNFEHSLKHAEIFKSDSYAYQAKEWRGFTEQQ